MRHLFCILPCFLLPAKPASQLIIGETIAGNAVIVVVGEGENQLEDGGQEEQTHSEGNAVTKGRTLLVLGGGMNHQAEQREDEADVVNVPQEAQHEDHQEQPAISPEDLVGNVVIIEGNQRCPSRLARLGINAPLRDKHQKPECGSENTDDQSGQEIVCGHQHSTTGKQHYHNGDNNKTHKSNPLFAFIVSSILPHEKKVNAGICKAWNPAQISAKNTRKTP